MSSTTPRAQLPLIAAAQAQKHVTHNDALLELDALMFARFLSRNVSTPPATPADGDSYLVKATATGAWTGQNGQIAYANGGVWRFAAPFTGLTAYVVDEAKLIVFNGTTWVDYASTLALQNVPLIGVNATADATNKFAVSSSALLFNNIGNGVQVKLNKNATADTASILYQTGFSGRAEIGLTGDDKFHFKVSSNGSSFTEAVCIDNASGNVGVRTTTPQVALDVNGSASFSGGANLNGALTVTGDANFFAVRNTANVGVGILSTVKAWTGTGTNVADLAIASNGAMNFYTNSGTTPAVSISPTRAASFSSDVNLTGNLGCTGASFVYSYGGGSVGQVRSGIFLDGANNVLSFYTSQTEAARLTSGGRVLVGTSTDLGARVLSKAPDGTYQLGLSGTTKGIRFNTSSTDALIEGVDTTLSASFQPLVINASTLKFQNSGSEVARFDSSGQYFLVGATSTSPTFGRIQAFNVNTTQWQNASLAALDSAGNVNFDVYNGSNRSFNAAQACARIAANTSTNRSLNTSGTINASGADYADYYTKRADCGVIGKGRVCGIDQDGLITDQWDLAVNFKIKSTDPCIVGGDRWGTAESIGLPEPDRGAIEQRSGESDTEFAARKAAQAEALEKFAAALAAARQSVDRLACSGKIPAVVSGELAAGDFVVPSRDGAGISLVAVSPEACSFEQFKASLGRIIAAHPAPGQFRKLIHANIEIDSAWNAIVDV